MKSYMDFGLPGGGQYSAEDLALVIDVSYSMDMKDYTPFRLKGAIEAGCALVKKKAAESQGDRVGVVAFGSDAETILSLTGLREHHKLISGAIRKLQTSGCTNIRAGLIRAGELLGGAMPSASPGLLGWLKGYLLETEQETEASAPEGSRGRRILLLSDGQANEGGDPVPIAAALKRQGVVIDVIGIAASPTAGGFNEVQLRAIASSSEDGREHYCFIADTQALIRKFESLALHIKPLGV